MIENNKNKEEYIFGRSNIPNKSFGFEKFKADLLKGIEFLRNNPKTERYDIVHDNLIKSKKYLDEINWDMSKINLRDFNSIEQSENQEEVPAEFLKTLSENMWKLLA